MTKFFVLIVAEAALLLLVPAAIFGWLGRRSARYLELARRYNRAVSWLLVGLLLYLVVWPLLQTLLRTALQGAPT